VCAATDDGSIADAAVTPEGEAPRLSVLVPSWNAATTIEWAIESVIADRHASLECIVIDDGSSDGTPEIVSAISDRDPRVVLLRLGVNEGVSHARNRGLAIARGEWIAFHDADDRMLPGWFDALMRPTADPDVLVVIGQRIWTDGERKWLSPLYDIPDIRQPGRKSIPTHPGLLYYASATGKAFHSSLLSGLLFEGRVLGDQAWTIRALLRADGHIEVVGETVFEWTRPRPERHVETITTVARASAMGAVEMTHVARRVFGEVSAEIDVQIADEPTRTAVIAAYFERLVRSDLGGPVRKAIERHDPETGALFDALAAFFEVVPGGVLRRSDHLMTAILRPPVVHWRSLVPSARPAYWAMVRPLLRVDPRMTYGIGGRARAQAFVVVDVLALAVVDVARSLFGRLRRS
jgi:hypothetical protein